MAEAPLPPVTLALFAYNQADTVEEAMASAFAQDYPNLEIILSDDHSPDDTFERMKMAAAAYTGPHRIVLNRNARNLHIGGHVNAVNRLASGELVIAAAGDDVSEPDRASALAEAWVAGGKRAGLLHSACYRWSGVIKERYGCPRADLFESLEQAAANPAYVIGATEAWAKDMFDHFGDLRLDLIHEDHALVFRSLLLRRPITYVDRPLVWHRQGTGVSTIYGSRHPGPAERRLMLSRYLVDVLQKIDDLAKAPADGIAPILERAADKYRVALRFEDCWPGPIETLDWLRRAGPVQVTRMIAKRLRNGLLDRIAA